jgi:hypothetical protein
MRKCFSLLPVLLVATGLMVLACQAPAPAAPAESTAAVAPATATAVSTEPSVPAATAQASAPVSETQTTEAPDPIAADPNRPGFTMDGSPSLGDPNAAIVIVDFSDFQ